MLPSPSQAKAEEAVTSEEREDAEAEDREDDVEDTVAPVSPVKNKKAADSADPTERSTCPEPTSEVAVCNEALTAVDKKETCTLEVLVRHTRDRIGKKLSHYDHSCPPSPNSSRVSAPVQIQVSHLFSWPLQAISLKNKVANVGSVV